MGNRIKLIMSDLDGTFLGDGHKPTEENLKAFQRAYDAGIKIVPVTARFLKLAEPVLKDIPMADYVVCCNGAALYDIGTKECLFRDAIDRETVLRILDYLDTLPCVQYAAINGTNYVDGPSFKKYYHTMEVPYLYKRENDPSVMLTIRDKVMEEGAGVEIIYVLFPDDETKAEADEVIKGFGDLCTLGAFPAEMEISAGTANKENITLRMKDILGVDPSEIMAFGDGDNDSGMIKAAGIGIAVENAMEKTKAAADYITLKNTESGVAYMVNKYLDGELE
ncbi:MAG: HAD family phosphatase [Lachnospiraceae bacterium]|nr:HAD family phosphatase [Lachnospiraceae bacterium]